MLFFFPSYQNHIFGFLNAKSSFAHCKTRYFKLTTYLNPRLLETFLLGVLHTKGW